MAPLFGAFCLETEKAFILARISGFIVVVAPRAPASDPAVGGGLPLAAFSVPNGVEEAVMLVVISAELVRPGMRGAAVGEPKGGEAGSESEGEMGGDSRGDCAGESSVSAIVGARRKGRICEHGYEIARLLQSGQTSPEALVRLVERH